MAIQTWYIANSAPSSTNDVLTTTQPGSIVVSSTILTMGKDAIGSRHLIVHGTTVGRADAAWTDGQAYPTGYVATASFRSPTTLDVTFPNTAWTFNIPWRAGTSASQSIITRIRVFASPNADGSGGRELTSAVQTSSATGTLSTTVTARPAITWSPGAISVHNEYIFITVACEVAVAGTSTSADARIVRETNAVCVTPNAVANTSVAVTTRNLTVSRPADLTTKIAVGYAVNTGAWATSGTDVKIELATGTTTGNETYTGSGTVVGKIRNVKTAKSSYKVSTKNATAARGTITVETGVPATIVPLAGQSLTISRPAPLTVSAATKYSINTGAWVTDAGTNLAISFATAGTVGSDSYAGLNTTIANVKNIRQEKSSYKVKTTISLSLSKVTILAKTGPQYTIATRSLTLSPTTLTAKYGWTVPAGATRNLTATPGSLTASGAAPVNTPITTRNLTATPTALVAKGGPDFAIATRSLTATPSALTTAIGSTFSVPTRSLTLTPTPLVAKYGWTIPAGTTRSITVTATTLVAKVGPAYTIPVRSLSLATTALVATGMSSASIATRGLTVAQGGITFGGSLKYSLATRTLTAAPSTLTATGQAFTSIATRTLTASPGSVTGGGAAAVSTPIATRSLTVSEGTITVSAGPAFSVPTRSLTASKSTLVATGGVSTPIATRSLTATPGTLTLTAVEISPPTRSLTATRGSVVAVTGASGYAPIATRSLTVTPTALTATGQVKFDVTTRNLTATKGSVTVGIGITTPIATRSLSLISNAVTATGAVRVAAGTTRTITLARGTLTTIYGQSLSITTRSITANHGSLIVQSAASVNVPLETLNLSLDRGTLTTTGKSLVNVTTRTLSATRGSFTVTGQALVDVAGGSLLLTREDLWTVLVVPLETQLLVLARNDATVSYGSTILASTRSLHVGRGSIVCWTSLPTVHYSNEVLERAMETARRLIDKYGGYFELVKFVDAAPVDVEKPWRINSTTEISQTVKGVFLSARRTKYGLPTDQQMDDQIPSKELKVLLAAKNLTNAPSMKGEIRFGGEAWSIASITPVAPDGDAIIYTLQVRK